MGKEYEREIHRRRDMRLINLTSNQGPINQNEILSSIRLEIFRTLTLQVVMAVWEMDGSLVHGC